MTLEIITQIAMSFPEVTESPHFEKTSFRIRKKIFATLNTSQLELVVKLSLLDQSVFCDMVKDVVMPVPGKWGAKGWTKVITNSIDEMLLHDLLKTAYIEVAPKKLSDLLD